jgi:hypothetical protein
MFDVRQPLGPIKIVEEQRFVIGTEAILDDEVRTLTRRESA